MRYALPFMVLLVGSQLLADESVQLKKSSYFDQHVTIAERDDHYLVHFNVHVRLDRPLESRRYLHASAAVSRPEGADVHVQKRSVVLNGEEATWSFYFRVSKYATRVEETRYAVIAKVDGIEEEACIVWALENGQVKVGDRESPFFISIPVGREVREERGDGSFRLVVYYEKKLYLNNYDALPITGFLRRGKQFPPSLDGERSARRVEE